MLDYFYTLLWSFTPFLELRASIPLGHLQFGLSIYESIAISIFGGILAAAFLIWTLPFFVGFFDRNIPFFHKIIQKVFAHTRAKHSHRIDVIGEIALVILVAIPLPGSGSWTGALVAYLFGLPKKKALWLISVGVICSAVIVAILTVTGHEIWEFFNEKIEETTDMGLRLWDSRLLT